MENEPQINVTSSHIRILSGRFYEKKPPKPSKHKPPSSNSGLFTAKLKTGVGLNATFLVKCYTLSSSWLHDMGARILLYKISGENKKGHLVL